jgi:putative DNA primase/helicase
MKSTLVFHGPQGTGKNAFFEALMEIYGPYGRVIDQNAIEDKFNDWASRKLFLIADEVVARSDLYHVKNKLKAFITGNWIRINPKNLAAYDERNHVNLVFLSNETMPVVLEEDDRRHAVIWTPEKLSDDFYSELYAEIDDGGIAALHDYLLSRNLGDFKPSTWPPLTDAKRELISLSRDTPSAFFRAWCEGDIPGFNLCHVLSRDAFELYRLWCQRQGDKRVAPLPKFVNALQRKHKVRQERKRYRFDPYEEPRGPHGVLMLGLDQPSPGEDETIFLGNQIARFRGWLRDYREAEHA